MKTTKTKTTSSSPTPLLSRSEKLEIFEEIKEKNEEKKREKIKKVLPFVIIGALVITGVILFFFSPINKIIDNVKQTQQTQIIAMRKPQLSIKPSEDISRDKPFEAMSAAPVTREKVTTFLDDIINYGQKFIGLFSGGLALFLAMKNAKETKKKRAASKG